MSDDQTEVLNRVLEEWTFLWLEEELVVLTFGEDTSKTSFTFSDGIGSDQEVIHIDMEPTFIELFPENLVHHYLEHGWWVTKTEEYDKGFEASTIRDESGLPFIALFDPDIVIPPVYVQLGEYFRVLDLVYEFRDQGEGISVLHSQSIEFPIILDRSKVTWLLFDKEEGGRDQWLQQTDMTSMEVFL